MRFTLLMLAFLSCAANVTAQTKCDPLPVLQIDGARFVSRGGVSRYKRVIHGGASIEGKPLAFATVQLYSAHKLFRHTTTDAKGNFLLENPPLGRYRLRFKGLGTFDIEVIPPHTVQEVYYGFTGYHGCLSWGADSD
jgi:hypothetical protein